MYSEFEKEDDSWRPEPAKWTVIVKKLFAYVLTALIVFIIGFLVIRSVISQPPKAMKSIVWDDTLFSVYKTEKDAGRELEVNRISAPDSFSDSNMFSVYTILYTPAAKQLQVTVRFNDRIFGYLAEEYPEATALISEGKDAYVFNLTYRKDDALHTVSAYEYVKDTKGGYTYYRLIFDGIELEGVANMTVNACYVGRPNTPRESVTVYSSGFTVLPFDYKKPKSAQAVTPVN